MHTDSARIAFAGHSVFRVDFHPDSLQAADLRWLPHHQALANAVTLRQAEHLAGRMAAVMALRELGCDAPPPAIGPHREPCWPTGFTGSITHAGTCAFAVALAQHRAYCGIGIDYERLQSAASAAEIAPEVASLRERAYLSQQPLPQASAITLLFSAKESLFKALFPQVGDWFGFEYAELTDLTPCQLRLRLTRPLGPFAVHHSFSLHWRREAEGLLTLVRY